MPRTRGVEEQQAPIEYSREQKGYYYSDDKFTLPGLWLTTSELQSLTFLLSVIEEIDEGLLHEEVSTVMQRIHRLLAARNIDQAELASRIRILPLGKRYIPGRTFLSVGDAILSRKRLWIRYCDYKGQTTEREVSPETLVHYRENWYLDAWCHLRQDLRTFSLSRVLSNEPRDRQSLNIDRKKLREHFTRSYGLFAGKPGHQARLRFFPAIAREIASQEWHSRQQGTWDGDDYVLSLPYSDPTELVQDILRHVPHAYVEAPAALRKQVQNRLHAGLELFSGKRIRRPQRHWMDTQDRFCPGDHRYLPSEKCKQQGGSIMIRSADGLRMAALLGLLANHASAQGAGPMPPGDLRSPAATSVSMAFGDGTETVGTLSRFHTAGLHVGAPDATDGAPVTAMSFTQRLTQRGFVHFSTATSDYDQASRIGLTLGRLTATAGGGQGERRPPEDHHYSAIPANFFHGAIAMPYRSRDLGARLALGSRSGVSLGGSVVEAHGLADRRSHFLGFDVGRMSLAGFDVRRGSDRVSSGLDLRLDLGRIDLAYTELSTRTEASWRRLGMHMELRGGSALGVRFESRRNRLYGDAEDTRVMLTWRTRLGPKRNPAKRAAAEDGRDDGEALEEAARSQRHLAWIAGGAAVAAVAASSGSSGSDGAPRYPSQDEAAFVALSDINPTSVRENREYGGSIYLNRDGTFSHTDHMRGELGHVAFNPYAIVPQNTQATAYYHTHGGPDPRFVNELFSPQDIVFARIHGIDGYLGTPAGRMWLYELRTDTIFSFFDANGSEFVLPN